MDLGSLQSEPEAAPEWATIPPVLAAPTCHATGCLARPLVQWQRRLTPVELAAEQAIEQARRDQLFADRDVELPPPDFGPMPGPQDYVHAVLACGPHAIDMDTAALVHQATCTGPDSANLPLCDCDPEPLPAPAPQAEQKLPAHWAAAVAGGAG
jgi:hypothetical protein